LNIAELKSAGKGERGRRAREKTEVDDVQEVGSTSSLTVEDEARHGSA